MIRALVSAFQGNKPKPTEKVEPVNDITPGEPFSFERYQSIAKLLGDITKHFQIAKSTNNPGAIQELLRAAATYMETAIAQVAPDEIISDSGTHSDGRFLELLRQLTVLLARSSISNYSQGANDLQVHLKYAEKHLPKNFNSISALGNGELAVLRDCAMHCSTIVTQKLFDSSHWHCEDPRRAKNFFDVSSVQAFLTPQAEALLSRCESLEGWCSRNKALLLYHLVREYKPRTVVEIGIYGGRSIVPIAAGIRDNGHGIVHGIETWSGMASTTYRTGLANDFIWANADYTIIKHDFLRFLLDNRLHDIVRVIEAPSGRCSALFDQIDLLHIDGNHSFFGAAKDVVDYASKVPPGGIIVYDDIDWHTTSAGLEILRDTCQLLHVVPNMVEETIPGCAAFIKV